MKKVIIGAIHQGNFEALKQLMRNQRSCTRYAYQRIHLDDLSKTNDIVKACKPLYMSKLNQRYISDAVLRARTIKKEHVIFGGHKLWDKILKGCVE